MAGVGAAIWSFLGSVGTSAGVGTATAAGTTATAASVVTGAAITAGTAVGVSKGVKALIGGAATGSLLDKETEKAKKDAEERSLFEAQQEDKNKAARRALLNVPTSGFGPNTNLARSFLTSL